MQTIEQRLDQVRALLSDNDFLTGKGLSNEVNIRIFPYDPKDEMAVRHFTEQVLTDTSLPCRIVSRNLYNLFLEICEDILDIPADEEWRIHSLIDDQDLFVECETEDSPEPEKVRVNLCGVKQHIDILKSLFQE